MWQEEGRKTFAIFVNWLISKDLPSFFVTGRLDWEQEKSPNVPQPILN